MTSPGSIYLRTGSLYLWSPFTHFAYPSPTQPLPLTTTNLFFVSIHFFFNEVSCVSDTIQYLSSGVPKGIMVSGLSQRQIQYMFVLSQMARFPSIYGYIIFHSVCIYLYTHTHRHHIFTPSSVNGHIGCFRTSSSSKGDPPSPLLRTFHDFPLSASLVATLSLQDHPHLSFFSLISLLQLHAAHQFKYLLPQGK